MQQSNTHVVRHPAEIERQLAEALRGPEMPAEVSEHKLDLKDVTSRELLQMAWDKAEKALEEALDSQGLEWELQPGEGAFYGPKIEYSLRDCLDRVWQLGTIQLDFSMPGRLDATYVAEDNTKKVPVMLHRAILGSLERFIGILIENYGGAFPAWLAPVQAVVLNITEKQSEYS